MVVFGARLCLMSEIIDLIMLRSNTFGFSNKYVFFNASREIKFNQNTTAAVRSLMHVVFDEGRYNNISFVYNGSFSLFC